MTEPIRSRSTGRTIARTGSPTRSAAPPGGIAPYSPRQQPVAGGRIWLNFDGINYIAEVWLNGHEVGTIKGAFTRGVFDVTSNLVAGASNVLAVHILPQPHPGDTHEKTIANGTGPNGGVTGLDGPTFLCTIGWDWIPTIRDRDSGIWQDVTLSHQRARCPGEPVCHLGPATATH